MSVKSPYGLRPDVAGVLDGAAAREARTDPDAYYANHYASVVYGGIGGAIQRMFHRAVERSCRADDVFETVLEVGSANAEHLPFVAHQYTRYVMLDSRESSIARAAIAARPNAEFIVGDAQDLVDVPSESCDRLVSMCLLHHLDDPHGALQHWRRVVKRGGSLSLFVPCDPGLLWRVGRAMTTFRRARQLGMSPTEVRCLNAREHRNHVASLRWMIAEVFADDEVRVRRFPFGRLGGWNTNLFMTFQITKQPATQQS